MLENTLSQLELVWVGVGVGGGLVGVGARLTENKVNSAFKISLT